MLIFQDTNAGGAEFDGTLGNGLLSFAALYNFGANGIGTDVVPVLYSVWFESDAVLDMVVVIREPAGGATERIVLLNRTGIASWDSAGCRAVPRDEALVGRVWELAFISANNGGTCSIGATWRPERV